MLADIYEVDAGEIISGSITVDEVIKRAKEKGSRVFVRNSLDFNDSKEGMDAFFRLEDAAFQEGVLVIFDEHTDKMFFYMIAPNEVREPFYVYAKDIINKAFDTEKIVREVKHRGMKVCVRGFNEFEASGEAGISALKELKRLTQKYGVFLDRNCQVFAQNYEGPPMKLDAMNLIRGFVPVDRAVNDARKKHMTIYIEHMNCFERDERAKQVLYELKKKAHDAGVGILGDIISE